MKTIVKQPDPAAISLAADIIRAGGLVAFPTETVYGLGGNALDDAAVSRIFAAKGRPARNPIIVHVHTVEAARDLATEWPELASRLAMHFWPGPLTLVLPKAACIPDIVTASGPTVALRMPAHPVALALLQASGVPVAAPSANRSNQLSPTLAEHVLRDLDGRIDMVLDGGPTAGGLESTVLDVTEAPPRLLRPGLITRAEIETLIGAIQQPDSVVAESEQVLRSPGTLGRHYAPRTPLVCHADAAPEVERLLVGGKRVGWLTFAAPLGRSNLFTITMPRDPRAYAPRLYAALHELDQRELDYIVVDAPPLTDEWLAIRDRLRRAAS